MPRWWEDESDSTIFTALEILEEESRKADARGSSRAPGAGGPQYSG
jgi:hypothetical protein